MLCISNSLYTKKFDVFIKKHLFFFDRVIDSIARCNHLTKHFLTTLKHRKKLVEQQTTSTTFKHLNNRRQNDAIE